MIAVLFLFSAQSSAEGWNYKYAYNCLKALSVDIKAPGTPVTFNRTGTGVFPATHAGAQGFYVITPKTAYFFPKDEMSRSGDAASTQLKITVNAASAS